MFAPAILREAARGARESVPIQIAVAPVGALFGTLAVGADMTVLQATVMSAAMFAGASQLVAVELLGPTVPVWSILLSVVAVNFRHVLYSAAVTPIVQRYRMRTRAALFFFLVDPVYAAAEREEAAHRFTLAWYFGFGVTTLVNWATTTFIGAKFGTLIEDRYTFGLDMILPIYFLALLLGFRERPNWLSTVLVAGSVAALVYHGPRLGLPLPGAPWHIAAGALAGVLFAALRPMPPKERAGAQKAEPAQ